MPLQGAMKLKVEWSWLETSQLPATGFLLTAIVRSVRSKPRDERGG